MKTNKFIFPESLQADLLAVLPIHGITSILPLEPPYIQVTKGKHVNKTKLGSVLHTLGLGDNRIKLLVEEYKQVNGDLSQYTVKYTTEYVEVYKTELYALDSTCKSCMTGETSVEIYDYDDRLSLLTIWKDKNKLVGRTLVRDDKKQFVRIYIDHNNIKSHIAKAIVDKEGYTEGNLEGIKLRYIEDGNRIVCPYLDKVYRFDIVDDEYLRIDNNGEYDGGTTDGFVEIKARHTCEDCGDSVHDEAIYYIDGWSICQDCLDRNYIYYNEEYYHKDNCVENQSNGEMIPECYIDDADIICTGDGDWYNSDEVVCVNDYYYHIDDCVQLVMETSDGDCFCLEEDGIELKQDIGDIEAGWYLEKQLKELANELEARILKEHSEEFEIPCSESVETLVEEFNRLKQIIGD